MGMRELEAGILREAREVIGKRTLRQKDIMEWRSGTGLKAEPDETVFDLPSMGVQIAVLDTALPKRKVPKS